MIYTDIFQAWSKYEREACRLLQTMTSSFALRLVSGLGLQVERSVKNLQCVGW